LIKLAHNKLFLGQPPDVAHRNWK